MYVVHLDVISDLDMKCNNKSDPVPAARGRVDEPGRAHALPAGAVLPAAAVGVHAAAGIAELVHADLALQVRLCLQVDSLK